MAGDAAEAPSRRQGAGVMILRRKHRGNFTVISNIPIKDEKLSAEALGVLLYLYMHPCDWRLSHKDLMRRFHIGRDKTYAIIGELKQAGYVTKHAMRTPEGHIIGCEYLVNDEPQQGSRAHPVEQRG
jgi:hypothetical protein